MSRKIPILLLTHDRPYLLPIVLNRIIKYTNWEEYDLWILDNASTNSNKKVIQTYLHNHKNINCYSSDINDVSNIQNEIVKKLKADIYIKIDDDILVTENWTEGFIGVFNRNRERIGFGSVVIPINGFGWVPFIEIMGFQKDFSEKFPHVNLVIGKSREADVWQNNLVTKYIWERCIDIDSTALIFKLNQNNSFQDLICNCHYSISAIIYSHSFWENMGGWKLMDGFNLKRKIYNGLITLEKQICKIRNKTEMKRVRSLINFVTNIQNSSFGLDEDYANQYCHENGLLIPVTTQSLVFHLSFFATEEFILNHFLLKLFNYSNYDYEI